MKKNQIAAQLFTLREFLKTPADIAASLKKVKKLGFDAVQVSGMGPIPEEELVKILDGEGLVCCATHENGATIVNEPDKVIDRLNRLHCDYTAYPYPHQVLTSVAEAREFAHKLNASAQKLAAAGKVLAYHNHAVEFTRFDGQLLLDLIYGNAPQLQSEIDTYWVQYGGGDPVAWVRRMAGRLPLLHLKELGIIDNQITMLPIGSGNLNWRVILAEAEKGGTRWFIIEQDVCRIDPFDSLKASLDYLTAEFVR